MAAEDLKPNKLNKFLVILSLVLAITCLFLVYNARKNGGQEYSQIITDLNKVNELIEANCLYSSDSEAMRQGILKGAVSSLDDPYSVYLDPTSYQALNDSISGSFAGLGIVVTIDRETRYVRVVSVYENSPAAKGGLQEGDLIVEVEGKDIANQALEVSTSQIKGEVGTQVALTVYREGEVDYLDLTFTREMIEAINVEGERLENNIAYIHLSQFDEKSGKEITDMLAKLEQEGAEAGIILDLRNNTGGSFTAALDVASLFIPEGPVVYIEDKAGNQQAVNTTKAALGLPVVVLVNGYSASSSEIVAGAIKDTDSGVLVGTTTFGKGLVQTIFKLSDGGALKLTTARYLTPDKIDINEVGIEPDVVVEPVLDNEADEQLEEAQKIMLEMLDAQTEQ